MVGRALVGVDHHRILHARAGPVLQRQLWKWVRRPEFRVELQRVPGDRSCVGVEVRTLGQVNHVNRDGTLAGNRRARRAPDEVLRGGPGEVIDRLGHEVPHEALAGGRRLAGAAFVCADDRDDGIRFEHMRQPLAGSGREHVLRILEDARAAHDPPGGHVDADIEPAEVVVELGWTQVDVRVPAAQIVEFRNPREPLGRLKEPVINALRHAVAAAVRATRKFRAPCDLDLGG